MAFGTATVLTTLGRAVITNRIKGSGTEPVYVAIGTGATGAARTAVVGDSALSTEKTTNAGGRPVRTTGTSTQKTTSTTNDTYQVVGTVTCAVEAWAVDEAALFDAATSGNMFSSATFPVVNLSIGDSIQCTLKVQLS